MHGEVTIWIVGVGVDGDQKRLSSVNQVNGVNLVSRSKLESFPSSEPMLNRIAEPKRAVPAYKEALPISEPEEDF